MSIPDGCGFSEVVLGGAEDVFCKGVVGCTDDGFTRTCWGRVVLCGAEDALPDGCCCRVVLGLAEDAGCLGGACGFGCGCADLGGVVFGFTDTFPLQIS
jgi:hypothetical protein